MESIKIHKVGPTEAVELQYIAQITFSETFATDNTEEDMQKYLDVNFANEELYQQLNTTDSSYYFAKDKASVVGYLKVNTGLAQTELKEHNSLEIERIYVLQAYQGHKIGQLLYEKAVQIATEIKADFIWLGIWEENHKAINFYQRNGFEAFDKHIFKLGDDEQTDIMMRLQLNNK